MKTRSSFIRWASLAISAALVFAQLGVAAVYCPQVGGAPHAEMMAGQADCHEVVVPAPKPLCIKLCQDEPQKNEVPSLDLPPVAVDAGLRVPTLEAIVAIESIARAPDLFHATAPPPRLQYARFLI